MVMRKAVSMADKKRKAPAYQEYASDILANRTYRLMTLQEKGCLLVWPLPYCF